MNVKTKIQAALLLCLTSYTLQAAPNAPDSKYLCILNPETCQGNQQPPPPPGKGFTNFIGITFVSIPAGSFYMGSRKQLEKDKVLPAEAWLGIEEEKLPSNIPLDPNVSDDELPLHPVTLSAFQMSAHEITVGQFKQFLRAIGTEAALKQGLLSEAFREYNIYGDNAPVTVVSWQDAQAFIAWLNQAKPSSDKHSYRLPTEAEWEYAARAGSQKIYGFADTDGQLGEYAWFTGNSGSQPHPVGQKKPNAWGLYDIQGNVWEWTCSNYTSAYEGKEQRCSENTSENKVLRGCAWLSSAGYCRLANRGSGTSSYRNDNYGFRLVAVSS